MFGQLDPTRHKAAMSKGFGCPVGFLFPDILAPVKKPFLSWMVDVCRAPLPTVCVCTAWPFLSLSLLLCHQGAAHPCLSCWDGRRQKIFFLRRLYTVDKSPFNPGNSPHVSCIASYCLARLFPELTEEDAARFPAFRLKGNTAGLFLSFCFPLGWVENLS